MNFFFSRLLFYSLRPNEKKNIQLPPILFSTALCSSFIGTKDLDMPHSSSPVQRKRRPALLLNAKRQTRVQKTRCDVSKGSTINISKPRGCKSTNAQASQNPHVPTKKGPSQPERPLNNPITSGPIGNMPELPKLPPLAPRREPPNAADDTFHLSRAPPSDSTNNLISLRPCNTDHLPYAIEKLTETLIRNDKNATARSNELRAEISELSNKIDLLTKHRQETETIIECISSGFNALEKFVKDLRHSQGTSIVHQDEGSQYQKVRIHFISLLEHAFMNF